MMSWAASLPVIVGMTAGVTSEPAIAMKCCIRISSDNFYVRVVGAAECLDIDEALGVGTALTTRYRRRVCTLQEAAVNEKAFAWNSPIPTSSKQREKWGTRCLPNSSVLTSGLKRVGDR